MTATRDQVPGFCVLCRSRCGARFVVEDGRFTDVLPWPGHPTGGALCAKGRASPELQYHPERLTQPLRRTTPRSDPDPRWAPVSWDEALADIGRRLSAIRAASGAHAVAFASASPGATALSDSLEWIERLVFAFGSPNFLTGVEICNWQRDHNHAHTFGTGIGMPDYARTDLVMLWGFTPGNVWLAQAQALAQARARGARLLVIDPARTRHAREADLWLPVAPGTDAALALGLARELIAHQRFDADFVRAWSNGPFLVRDDDGALLTERALDPAAPTDHPLAWNTALQAAVPVDTAHAWPGDAPLALRGRWQVAGPRGPIACRTSFEHYVQACEPYTPERVEALTGVPAADVRAAAAMIADARAVSYFSWTGIAQHANATQADRAIALLYALTGCVDAPGGNLHLARLPARAANDRALLPPAQAHRALGLAERPLGPPAHGWTLGADFHRAVVDGEPYRVRALVAFGANLLMSQPDTARMRQALEGLELQVHVDLFESPTARHADYLLPACTPWEREGLRIGFEISGEAQQTVQLRPPVVPVAQGQQARPDIDIVFDLATRLGLGEAFFGGDVEAGWNHVLAPLGLSMAQLRARPEGVRVPLAQTERRYAAPRAQGGGVRGFATPSGRVEFYSARLRDAGAAPVPHALADAGARTDAAAGAGFPLLLTGAKSGYYCQSQHRALASLRAREPEPTARLHPRLAASRGIAAGDWFEIVTRGGRARLRAVFDDALREDTVAASFGWWQACRDLGLAARDPLAEGHDNVNALVDATHADPVSGAVALRSYPCDARALPGAQGWNGWKPFVARCIGRPAAGVIELELRARDGAPLPSFFPGQHVRLALGGPGPGRRVRSYSLTGPADPAAQAGEGAGHASYTVAVRQRPDGDGEDSLSRALHAAFEATPDQALALELQRPAGRFLLPTDPVRPVVLIAAGIGITPFMSLLETLAARGDLSQPVLLLHGSRDAAHHAFAARIARLAERLPRLQVITFHSRAPAADAARGGMRGGRVGAAQVPAAWIEADARFYLCGPPAMLRETTLGLRSRGVPRWAIFSEAFDASDEPRSQGRSDATDPPPARPHRVHFARSGRTAEWTGADRSLLALADRLGLPLAGGCRVGQCETCVLQVRSGRVRHRVETASLDDGTCLACVAVPTSDVEIDA